MNMSNWRTLQKVIGASLWALPLSFLGSLGAAALATTIELQVLPLLRPSSGGQSAGCPSSLIAYETAQPYAPGGYSTQGMIQLRAIATNISVTQRNDFSATWTGTLKPEYRNCKASAGIVKVDGEDFTGHSYLRLQLLEGQVRVILDMTGMRDANNYTTVIIDQTMRDGNPRWTWGGTD